MLLLLLLRGTCCCVHTTNQTETLWATLRLSNNTDTDTFTQIQIQIHYHTCDIHFHFRFDSFSISVSFVFRSFCLLFSVFCFLFLFSSFYMQTRSIRREADKISGCLASPRLPACQLPPAACYVPPLACAAGSGRAFCHQSCLYLPLHLTRLSLLSAVVCSCLITACPVARL